jgi:hypothetical protein
MKPAAAPALPFSALGVFGWVLKIRALVMFLAGARHNPSSINAGLHHSAAVCFKRIHRRFALPFYGIQLFSDHIHHLVLAFVGMATKPMPLQIGQFEACAR